MATVNELREQYDSAVSAFFAELDEFDPETLETEVIFGTWTPRDLAGHMVDWQKELVICVRHALGGPTPHGHPLGAGSDIDTLNSMMAARRTDQLWDDVYEELTQSCELSRKVFDEVSDEDLDKPALAPRGHERKVEELLRQLSRHFEGHVEDLQAWKASRQRA